MKILGSVALVVLSIALSGERSWTQSFVSQMTTAQVSAPSFPQKSFPQKPFPQKSIVQASSRKLPPIRCRRNSTARLRTAADQLRPAGVWIFL